MKGDSDVTPQREESYVRGVSLYHSGRYEQAAAVLTPASAGDDVIARLAGFYAGLSRRAMGVRELRRGRFHLAEAHLRAAAATLGRRSGLAEYLLSSRASDDGAVARIERNVPHDRRDARAWSAVARAQWNSGRRVAAQMTITAAMRRLGGEGALHLQMGLFQAAEGRYEEATGSLGRAVAARPIDPEAHFRLGLVRAAQGDATAALDSFQRALDLRGDDVLVAYHVALAARAVQQQGGQVALRISELNDPRGETEHWRLARYIASDPDFLDALLSLPASDADAELMGLLAEANEMALAEHPDRADLHRHGARIFRRLGRLRAARRSAERAVELNPRYADAMLELATIHETLGELDRAGDWCRRATVCGADYPDVHCRAGELLRRGGRDAEARQHFRRALELKADYARATDGLNALAA